MARYTGPKSKIARKFREPIFGPDKALEKKNYPPGMHGLAKKRMKQSEYAVQLQEKQKAKYTYGMLEKQFSNTFQRAARAHGVTGEVLMQLVELRLDNVVYRMGISNTRDGARQLVSHRHITVNGSVVSVPSYSVKVGDVIEVREKSKSMEVITDSVTRNKRSFPWITWDARSMKGTLIAVPQRADIPENIREQLIVELYSR
ncbi:MAG: 30S ribosomal protein S4 [Bacteroidota bacterium]|jgi:small subunit ribosomal protein S4